MTNVRRVMVRSTAFNLKDHLDEEFGIDTDIEVLENIIDINIGFVVDAIEEISEFGEEFNE